MNNVSATTAPTLAESQQALLATLFATGPGRTDVSSKFIAFHAVSTSSRGLNAYQNNAHMLAERSLQAVYPVLAQLLGAESFTAFARAFWHAHPPVQGDLAQWGDALPGFISASPQLADVPYLSDVARVEWALHRSATARDAKPDLTTLQRLMSDDPAHLTLRLAPGLHLLTSPWPVVSLVLAHLEAPEAPSPNLSPARQRLSDGMGETAVVWREGHKPMLREALAGEFTFLNALQQGIALENASFNAIDFDFTRWLPLAVSTGLLLSVAPLPSSSSSSSSSEPKDSP